MGKRKRIKELEERCDRLEKEVRHAQSDITRLLVWKSVQTDRGAGFPTEDGNGEPEVGVPTPGVWRIRRDPNPDNWDHQVEDGPQWWQGSDDAENGEYGWVSEKEYSTGYRSLIEAVRALENLPTKKGRPKSNLWHKPVIVEPSGGVYNERDGRNPNAEPIEPKQAPAK